MRKLRTSKTQSEVHINLPYLESSRVYILQHIPIMVADYHVLEPFPLFVDSKGPSASSYYYSSKMSLVSLFNSDSSASRLRSRISIPDKATNYIRLKYYQYEVTFGLYVMEPMEKLVVNTIVFTILSLLLYGIIFGLKPLLIRTICRTIWCLSGSYEGVEDICSSGCP